MPDEPKRSLTRELAALDGPVHVVDDLQTNLAAILASVLEKRQAIKKHLGSSAQEVEDEIARICALFTSNNRRAINQAVLDAYAYNRYVKVAHKLSTDAPATALETMAVAEEFGGRPTKDTLPYGQRPVSGFVRKPSVEIEISPETFDNLFDDKAKAK